MIKRTRKLTELQQFKLQEAHRYASDVLRELKQFQLTGPALRRMQVLEEAVQFLEVACFE